MNQPVKADVFVNDSDTRKSRMNSVDYYSRKFFTYLSHERLYRLSRILQESEGLTSPPSMFGFEKAYFYKECCLWHFFHADGLFIVTEKQIHSIGTWLDAQEELNEVLEFHVNSLINKHLKSE